MSRDNSVPEKFSRVFPATPGGTLLATPCCSTCSPSPLVGLQHSPEFGKAILGDGIGRSRSLPPEPSPGQADWPSHGSRAADPGIQMRIRQLRTCHP